MRTLYLIAILLLSPSVAAAESKPNYEIVPYWRLKDPNGANRWWFLAYKVSRATNELFICDVKGTTQSAAGTCRKITQFSGSLQNTSFKSLGGSAIPYTIPNYDFWLIDETSGQVTFCLTYGYCIPVPNQP